MILNEYNSFLFDKLFFFQTSKTGWEIAGSCFQQTGQRGVSKVVFMFSNNHKRYQSTELWEKNVVYVIYIYIYIYVHLHVYVYLQLHFYSS